MVWFFVVVSLLAVSVIALVVWPLLRTHSIPRDQRQQQNVGIAHDRLRQLQEAVDDGLVAPELAEKEQAEIERALLEDVAVPGGAPMGEQSQKGWWGGVAVVVLVPLLAGALYLGLGEPAAVATPVAGVAATQAEHTEADLPSMVRTLEQRLAAEPEDAEGWYMLGNSYMVLKQYEKAAGVFAKLRELVGDDPDLMIRHADALAMTKGGELAGEPEELILAALELRPDHPVALWLAGISAQRRGEIEKALQYWLRAEPLYSENAESRAQLQALIAQAKEQLAAAQEAAAATSAPADDEATKGQTGRIEVRVSLHDSLKDKVDDEDALFILARAKEGPPMPLAVVRKRAGDLPLSVTLSDSMAMVPNMTLSQHDEVLVVARISSSGQALPRSGDLEGRVTAVVPGTDQPVKVVISMQVQ